MSLYYVQYILYKEVAVPSLLFSMRSLLLQLHILHSPERQSHALTVAETFTHLFAATPPGTAGENDDTAPEFQLAAHFPQLGLLPLCLTLSLTSNNTGI